MARKDTDMKEYKLKGQVTEVLEDGSVKVEVVKSNSVDTDEENILQIGRTFLEFCKKYENEKDTIEMTCSIKAIKE
ncbi:MULTISPECIES: hypothetical protein [Clostridium]|uniref:hypothetical protein n=1 Tax=Clostridium TaxID=1485 RepID=UPI000773C577|nr:MULTISPECIES: hypothetical protein [Clostridium]APH20870.1 hypothetical protein NPD1_4318 [Clostridium botulinum]APQ71372.1 hypothetical protein RSJ8_4275 [Clostridium botulinum]MBN3379137.1 hypothetical protein [Clostridium botulinum]NFF77319.1 hypothetical protein [Clostridium sporogenes]NFH40699.1 hypothetical protein [Clostridium sporogenes]